MRTGWPGKMALMLMIFGSLVACKKQTGCGLRTGPAVATGAHTPHDITRGEAIVITLSIKVPDTACVQGATARIAHVNRDTFHIRPEIVYSDPAQSEDCTCSSESTLKGSVVFRTDKAGAFYFTYDRERDMSNNSGGTFVITAH